MISVYYKEITTWRRIIPFISHEWKGSNTIRSLEDLPSPSGWWFQPIWKIFGSSPQVGMKINNIWNHHLARVINHFNKSWDPPPSRWPFLFGPLLVRCSAPFQNSVPPTRSASSPYRHGLWQTTTMAAIGQPPADPFRIKDLLLKLVVWINTCL